MDSQTKYVTLTDRGDRLGAHLTWYISTILLAIKNGYKIKLTKPRTEYRYANTIFVIFLFDFIESYNSQEGATISINEDGDFFKKHAAIVRAIQSDYISFFKQHIFQDGQRIISALAKTYSIPFNPNKTIAVHLRLDDTRFRYHDTALVHHVSEQFRDIVESDGPLTFPTCLGQSAMNESILQQIINKALSDHSGYEVIIFTSPNSRHSLPYRTIASHDESYDLYLLSRCKVLVGSRSTFSLSAMYFGDYEQVYYPIWEHAVVFGLTTKYDRNKNITFF